MFERFTDRARRVVVLAQEEARLLHHGYIGTEHLLLGLITEGSGVGAKALEALGVGLDRARAEVTAIIGDAAPGPEPGPGHIPFTPRSKRALELSLREALTLGHNYIGTEHILLGLIREDEGVGAQVLIRLGADLGRVRAKVIELLQGFMATAPRERLVDAAIERFDRFTPGLEAAIEAAASYASNTTIGSHHLLAVFADWDDIAANAVLRAGGFDQTRLASSIVEWPVDGTRDETAEQWGMRVTEVETTDEGVLIAMRDPELRARIKSAIEGGHGPSVQAMIGEALKQLASKLPPADPPAEGETPGAAEG